MLNPKGFRKLLGFFLGFSQINAKVGFEYVVFFFMAQTLLFLNKNDL